MAERWLLISFYFPPDRGAAANRMFTLAQQLKSHGHEVEVWCPMPHYPQAKVPKTYRGHWQVVEEVQGIRVKRFYIQPNQSKNIGRRLWAALSFVAALTPALVFHPCPKQVLIQCPPLPLAAWAQFWLRLRGKKVVLNVSDLWPETGLALGILKPQSFSTRLMAWTAQRCYRHAQVVLGQSNEIVAEVQKIAPKVPVHLYRNFPHPLPPAPLSGPELGPLKVGYAGLLGLAQDVHFWAQAPLWKNGQVELHLWGDGPQSEAIEKAIATQPNSGVILHGLVAREQLPEAIAACHVMLIPLAQPLQGAVPSKLFEWAQLGLPSILLAEGEAADLLHQHQLGWVLPPGDLAGLADLLEVLQLRTLAEWTAQRQTIWIEAQNAFSMEKQWKNSKFYKNS